jgi:DNA-binding protein HU-beta
LTLYRDSGTIPQVVLKIRAEFNNQSATTKGYVPVNKNDLVASVAEISGLTKADALKAIDGVIQSITTSLKQDQEVRLVGFGTFSVKYRLEGEGRNPRTGEKIKISASKLPKFRAGKTLKDAIA